MLIIKRPFVFFSLGLLIVLSSFAYSLPNEFLPRTITRNATLVDGKKVERTVILLDGSTSREDVIQTCNFLAKENVQLNFDKLSIGKSFLGLFGKQRLQIVEGKITLPNGASQSFKAGGPASFKFLKIQYVSNPVPESSQIEMIEIVD